MAIQFRTVQEYLQALPDDSRAEVETLRAIVADAHPDVTEIIKWNSPSYVLDGVDRLTISAAGKGPVRLVLHFGTERAEVKGAAHGFDGDPGGLLTWHSDIRASMTVTEPGAMRDVVRAWLLAD